MHVKISSVNAAADTAFSCVLQSTRNRRHSTGERTSKEAALAALYNEYYDKIARYIFAKIGDRVGAEDLASETFLYRCHCARLARDVTARAKRIIRLYG